MTQLNTSSEQDWYKKSPIVFPLFVVGSLKSLCLFEPVTSGAQSGGELEQVTMLPVN